LDTYRSERFRGTAPAWINPPADEHPSIPNP
jgi:hypothetical protein